MKRNVILYIAMSLDGYLADKYGGVDWLKGENDDYTDDTSYQELLDEIDIVIMGYSTYNQVANELSPDSWPYTGKKTYVLSHRMMDNKEDIEFVNESVIQLYTNLQIKKGKSIWVCGGSSVVSQFINEDLIDEYRIFIIPTILGDGISLFSNIQQKTNLSCKSVTMSNGIIRCVYSKSELK